MFLQDHQINLAHIESRSSKRSADTYEFMVEIDNSSIGDVKAALEDLKENTKYCQVIRDFYVKSISNLKWKISEKWRNYFLDHFCWLQRARGYHSMVSKKNQGFGSVCQPNWRVWRQVGRWSSWIHGSCLPCTSQVFCWHCFQLQTVSHTHSNPNLYNHFSKRF